MALKISNAENAETQRRSSTLRVLNLIRVAARVIKNSISLPQIQELLQTKPEK